MKTTPENEETPVRANASEAGKAEANQPEVSTGESVAVKRDAPKPGTLIDAIYKALRRGEKLTPTDAWLIYGTSRLAAVIHKLKECGWPIHAEIIAVETADGRTAYVAQYEMREAA